MPQKESASSQQFIEIETIENDIVRMKNGGLRKVLLVAGMNFDLKSEEEQGLITYAFQGFLNSLDFSTQIFIHSRKLNVESYLKKITGREVRKKKVIELTLFIFLRIAREAERELLNSYK